MGVIGKNTEQIARASSDICGVISVDLYIKNRLVSATPFTSNILALNEILRKMHFLL